MGRRGVRLFERALALDPDSVEARSRLAIALVDRVLENLSDSREADIFRAEELTGQALSPSPRDPLAHFAKSVVLRARGRPEEAIPEFETVLAFDRNAIGALFHLVGAS